MTYYIDIQHVSKEGAPVEDQILEHWAVLCLKDYFPSAELTLRLVDAEEIQRLNAQFRGRNSSTNVLAFPAVHAELVELDVPLLGDVIICPSVLKAESIQDGKPELAHWAHIVIHGILHLMGYDHQTELESSLMQAKEIALLAELGFDNPYQDLALDPLPKKKRKDFE